jgi:hypothetical protein
MPGSGRADNDFLENSLLIAGFLLEKAAETRDACDNEQGSRN